MINKLTDEYRSWLLRYSRREDCRNKHAAISLREQLNAVESIEGLQTLLHSFSAPPQAPSFFNHDTIDDFIPKMNEIMQRVSKLVTFDPRISCTQLDSLSTFELRIDNQLSLNQVFAVLSQHDLHIRSMRNKTNRLEELFMDLIYHDH